MLYCCLPEVIGVVELSADTLHRQGGQPADEF